MSVYYSGYTRQPSIYDLLSVPDYTNPLNITMGLSLIHISFIISVILIPLIWPF